MKCIYIYKHLSIWQPYNISVPLDLKVTCDTRLTLNIYIRLKIKPNSVRIRSLSWQMFVLPSTGFELTPLINCNTNRLALCPGLKTTRSHPLYLSLNLVFIAGQIFYLRLFIYKILQINTGTISESDIAFAKVRGLWYLRSLLTIFELYRGGQLYWWRIPEDLE